MNKEKQFGLSPLPKDTLLPCAASPTDARTDGRFPFVCIRPGFRARETQNTYITGCHYEEKYLTTESNEIRSPRSLCSYQLPPIAICSY